MATVSTPRRRRPAPAEKQAAVDPLCLRIPTSAFTLAGFRAWATSDAFPEHVRAAFIDQEVYLDMTKEDPEAHVSPKGEITRVLLNLNREVKSGKFYADGLRVSNEAAGVSNDPDGTFVSWETLDSGRARLVPREGEQGRYTELEGTPDWLMEIVSDSSVQKDTERLRAAYHRAGVREYWLIDARGDDIAFQILSWRKTGYVAAPNRDGWQRSKVFGRSFRLVRERDRRGFWEYTLEVRSEAVK
jgi:Uma2 family endonuclease